MSETASAVSMGEIVGGSGAAALAFWAGIAKDGTVSGRGFRWICEAEYGGNG